MDIGLSSIGKSGSRLSPNAAISSSVRRQDVIAYGIPPGPQAGHFVMIK
jgi:hypothetical protein